MTEHTFAQVDFEHPSFFFRLEDRLKGLLGGPLFYDSYYRSFGLKGDENVIEFGCGGGTGAKRLMRFLNNAGHLTCIDISNYWIARAKERLKCFSNVDCYAGDIRELEIKDSLFDIITTIYVIHDIAPSERQDIIKVLCMKLKKGGFFFIREPGKVSHGIAADEIRTLMSASGMQEIQHRQTKSEFQGRYIKSG